MAIALKTSSRKDPKLLSPSAFLPSLKFLSLVLDVGAESREKSIIFIQV
jgi:hypothetical protein